MWNTCCVVRRKENFRTTKVKVKLLQHFMHTFTLACKTHFVAQTSAPAPDSDLRIHARSQMLSVSPDAFPPCVNMKKPGKDEKEKNNLLIYLKYICNIDSLKESRFDSKGWGEGSAHRHGIALPVQWVWQCSSHIHICTSHLGCLRTVPLSQEIANGRLVQSFLFIKKLGHRCRSPFKQVVHNQVLYTLHRENERLELFENHYAYTQRLGKNFSDWKSKKHVCTFGLKWRRIFEVLRFQMYVF